MSAKVTKLGIRVYIIGGCGRESRRMWWPTGGGAPPPASASGGGAG
jgi:hypothetical protein